MNQFDNAKFLQIPYFASLDQQLLNYIDYQYNLIKNEFPYLIKTDKQWYSFIKKNELMSFKIKYFHTTYFKKYNDFILFMCLKYDISRLENILSNDNKFIYINFFNNKYSTITIHSFLYSANSLFKFINNYAQSQIIDYINVRIILPVYSVLIPFYIKRYKILNKKKERIFIHKLFKNFINDYFSRTINSNDINKEYIKKMQSFAILIQNFFINNFINHPSDYSFKLLLNSVIQKINESNSLFIINFIKNKKLSLVSLKKIQEHCILNKQQQDFIQSHILLAELTN